MAIVAIFYEALKFARDSLDKTKTNRIQSANRKTKLNGSTLEIEENGTRAQKDDAYFRYVFVTVGAPNLSADRVRLFWLFFVIFS